MREKRIRTGVSGVFDHPESCAQAIGYLLESGRSARSLRVYSPVPDHRLEHALGQKVSPLGYITLIGAITGLVGGFALAMFTSLKWGLVVWGKPLIAWLPWVIVGFEFTILLGCLANFTAMLIMSGLPRFKSDPGYDPRFSQDKYGIFVPCDPSDRPGVLETLRSHGAVEVHEHG